MSSIETAADARRLTNGMTKLDRVLYNIARDVHGEGVDRCIVGCETYAEAELLMGQLTSRGFSCKLEEVPLVDIWEDSPSLYYMEVRW